MKHLIILFVLIPTLFNSKTYCDIIKGIIEFDDFDIYTLNFLSRKKDD